MINYRKHYMINLKSVSEHSPENRYVVTTIYFIDVMINYCTKCGGKMNLFRYPSLKRFDHLGRKLFI